MHWIPPILEHNTKLLRTALISRNSEFHFIVQPNNAAVNDHVLELLHHDAKLYRIIRTKFVCFCICFWPERLELSLTYLQLKMFAMVYWTSTVCTPSLYIQQ